MMDSGIVAFELNLLPFAQMFKAVYPVGGGQEAKGRWRWTGRAIAQTTQNKSQNQPTLSVVPADKGHTVVPEFMRMGSSLGEN